MDQDAPECHFSSEKSAFRAKDYPDILFSHPHLCLSVIRGPSTSTSTSTQNIPSEDDYCVNLQAFTPMQPHGTLWTRAPILKQL